MNKKYLIPTSISFEMCAEQMIATSTDDTSAGVSDQVVDGSQALSNQQNMWGNSNMWK